MVKKLLKSQAALFILEVGAILLQQYFSEKSNEMDIAEMKAEIKNEIMAEMAKGE